MVFLKKKARGLRKAIYNLKRGYPVKVHGEKFHVETSDIGYWKNVNNGDWEPETFIYLQENLEAGDIYVDIGAWAGPTALYASRKCAEVFCFEPDPVAFNKLTKNIRLNKATNIHAFNIAVGHFNGTTTMSSAGAKLGDTMTSMVTDHTGKETFKAMVMTWDRIRTYCNLDAIKMIKIDVEGAEFDLIHDMVDYLKKHQPVLWLSIHPTFMPKNTVEQKINSLIEDLSFYTSCYDQKLQKVSIDEMKSAESLKGYPSFLFKME